MQSHSLKMLFLLSNLMFCNYGSAAEKVALFADSNGNIGIGTSKESADAQLEVSGNLLIAPKTTYLSTTPSALVSVNAVYLLVQNGGFSDAAQAGVACAADGARLATYEELTAAFNNGATWCQYGWMVPNSQGAGFGFPNQIANSNCGARGVVTNWGRGPIMANCIKTVALQVSGDVRIDGHLMVNTPTAAEHAATKLYVDNAISQSNQSVTSEINALRASIRAIEVMLPSKIVFPHGN